MGRRKLRPGSEPVVFVLSCIVFPFLLIFGDSVEVNALSEGDKTIRIFSEDLDLVALYTVHTGTSIISYKQSLVLIGHMDADTLDASKIFFLRFS